METDFDGQRHLPVQNTVEVLNGQSFRDAMLRPRVEPLYTARTSGELLAALGPAQASLQALGANPHFKIVRDSKSDLSKLRTIVDLRQVRPARQLSLSTRMAGDLFGVGISTNLYNSLKLGDLLEVEGRLQPEPNVLGSGTLRFTTPMPVGRAMLTLAAFFFNESRRWASHDLASHGVEAHVVAPPLGGFQLALGARAVARNIHTISDHAGDFVRACAGASSLKVCADLKLSHSGAYHTAQLQIEKAGVPGDVQHLKAQLQFALDASLTPNNELEAHYSANAGLLQASGAKHTLCDMFLLGGPDSVLGFARNKLRAFEATTNDFVGGQCFYSQRFALLGRLPYSPPTSPLRLKAQIDSGALMATALPTLSQNVTKLSKLKPALSASAGLTYHHSDASFDVLYVLPLAGDGERMRGSIYVCASLKLD